MEVLRHGGSKELPMLALPQAAPSPWLAQFPKLKVGQDCDDVERCLNSTQHNWLYAE
jgi:hypothetical protein